MYSERWIILFELQLTKLLLRLHNLSYALSTRFAVRLEGGLHPKHRLMNYHSFFTDNVNNGDKVLDIGCGNGALAYDVAGKAGQVIAIDKSSINIQTAQMNYARENIEYITGDATRVTLEDNFDVIILSNVLEHIEERVDFLAAVKKYAPKILLRVPMLNRDWITLYKKELGIEWRLDKTHFTEYTVESLLKELSEGGVELIRYSVQFGEIWGVAKQLNQD